MIRDMESELKEIKQNVVASMEKKIDELKASLIVMLEKPNTKEKSFSTALQRNRPEPRTTDEASSNSVANIIVSDSSQTLLKTVAPTEHVPVPTQTQPSNDRRDNPSGQRVPVRITNRSSPRTTILSGGIQNRIDRNPKPSQSTRPYSRQHQSGKTLLIGDSILNPINTKGLVRGTHKHARGGATINDIANDIGLYDLTAFETIIISVGGNDSARKTNSEQFVESYDKLISLIKTSNPQSTVYVCKVAPRGDTDVSIINDCIEKLTLHWQKHDVMSISNTRDYFYGKDRVPTERYFSKDGIHLSRSGVKRLLDAINSNTQIVSDYDSCVFNRQGYQRGIGKSNQNRWLSQEQGHWHPRNRGPNNTEKRHANKICYACHMVGHISAECWN